jgi:hypothetical protein
VRYKGTIAAPQGVVNVTFSLYSAETGGTAVWSETQNVTVDNAGNFSALIGAGTTGGLPESIFVTEAARWLGVAVTGQAENPRVLLVSVPYAMSAVEAQRLGGHDASEFVLQSQLSGGSTGGATGGTTSGGAVTPTVSGTTGYISKFNAADSVDNSVIFQDANGNIGIGTSTITSADTKLEVAGRVRVKGVNAPSTPDDTTSVATFTNAVTPSVDQSSASHQSFISNTQIFGNKAVFQALGGLFEADTFGTGHINQLFGGYGTVYVGNAATVDQAVAFNNDAYSGSGTTQFLVGMRTSANTSKDTGASTTTVNQIGVLVDSNTKDASSTVTNSFGLLVNDQAGVGTNNWAIKTGTGLVDFGDKTQFAVATANRASLNIPLGVAPSSPQEGDIWNDGTGLKIFSGGVTQSLATTGDLSGFASTSDLSALQSALTAESNARSAADLTLQGDISNEAAIRAAADTAQQSSVTAEAAARTSADNTLQSNIDSEASARAATDTSLQSNITAEATARAAADTALQNNINSANAVIAAEATARAAADTALNSSITSIQNSLTTIDSGSAKLATDNVFTAGNDFSGATSTSPVQVVNTLPASCVGGKQMVILSTDPAGKQLYICNSDNSSWSLVGDGAPGAATSGDITSLQAALTTETNARSAADVTLQSNIDAANASITTETSARTAADSALSTSVANETSARTAADTALSTSITNETSARQAADTTLQANIDAANASIATETSARTAADAALSTSITNETSARQAADTTLQSNIDAANAAITAETAARTAADTALSTSIANETSARQSADTTLQLNIDAANAAITAETSARTAADTTLQSNIDAANTAVTNEATARASADTTLQNNINAEATTRATADTGLQANIAAEAAARAAADTALSTSISNVQSSLTTLDSGSAKLSGNNTFTGANDFSGASSTSPVKVVTIATTPSTCVANKDLILKSDAPTGQQLFVCNGSGNGFNLLGGSTNGTVTNIATGAGLTGGPISSTGTISIATGGVSNAMLANSGVTVTAGTGLSGGGAVSLGGSITLNNTGALSFNGRTGAVSPAANDYSFAQISGTAVASQGGTGVTSSGAAGNVLRSNGTAWTSSAIQASDLPSLSSTYVDLSSAQTIAGTKTFSSTISGNISGTASNVTGIVATANGGTGLNAAGTVGNILVSDGTNWTSSAPTVLSGNYVDRTTNQSIAGTKTFTGVVDNTTATQTLPVRAVTVATMGTSCTASKEMIVVTDGQAGRQLWLCNSAGNGWNLLGDGIGGNGVTFNSVNVPANSLLLTKNTCSTTYTGTYPTVVAGQDIPIPPATGTLTQQSTLVVSPISSMSNSMPAGWTSYTYYAYVDASNQAFLHVCNPTQNNISTLSGGSGAITFNVRAIN